MTIGELRYELDVLCKEYEDAPDWEVRVFVKPDRSASIETTTGDGLSLLVRPEGTCETCGEQVLDEQDHAPGCAFGVVASDDPADIPR